MSGKKRSTLIAGMLVVVLLVSGFAVPAFRNSVLGLFSNGQETPEVVAVPADQPMDIGSGVAVFGDAVRKDMKATPIKGDYPAQGDAVIPLSDLLRITPEGKLPGKTTLVFTLKKSVDFSSGAAFVATREAGKDWTFVPMKLSADHTTVSVEADHLSEWAVFFVNAAMFLGNPLKDLIASVFLEPFAEAKVPPCPTDQSKRAATDNYKAGKQTGDAVASCFARKDDKSQRTMTITNKRRYPMEVDHSGFRVVDAGRIEVDFANLARWGSGRKSILYPNRTIQYSVELEMNRYAKISTAYSGLAASYARMDVALQALAYIVAKLNIKFVTNLDDNMVVIDKMLGIHDCAKVATDKDANFGELIHKCFVSGVLGEIYGSVGIVMGGLATVTSLVSWLAGEFISMKDMLQNRDRSAVTVSRVDPFAKYVGRHSMEDAFFLVVRPDTTGYFETHIPDGTVYIDKFKLVSEGDKVYAVITEPSNAVDEGVGDFGMAKGMRFPLRLSDNGNILKADFNYGPGYSGTYEFCTPRAPRSRC